MECVGHFKYCFSMSFLTVYIPLYSYFTFHYLTVNMTTGERLLRELHCLLVCFWGNSRCWLLPLKVCTQWVQVTWGTVSPQWDRPTMPVEEECCGFHWSSNSGWWGPERVCCAVALALRKHIAPWGEISPTLLTFCKNREDLALPIGEYHAVAGWWTNNRSHFPPVHPAPSFPTF